jgi:hypothetical protein
VCYASDRRRTQFETSTTKIVTDGCGTASTVFEKSKALSAHNDIRDRGDGDHRYQGISQGWAHLRRPLLRLTLGQLAPVVVSIARIA